MEQRWKKGPIDTVRGWKDGPIKTAIEKTWKKTDSLGEEKEERIRVTKGSSEARENIR